MKTQAYFIKEHGAAEAVFELRDLELSTLGSDQVQIEVEAFGLNFADVLARKGLYKEAPDPPFVVGYDVVGKVTAVGNPSLEHWKGKRVTALTRFGGYAQHVHTAVAGIAEIPNDMDAATATALATQYATACYAAHYLTRVLPGDKVLVHSGAGGVGSALVQLCKRAGATVYVTVGSAEKAKSALANGADRALLYKEEDYAEALKHSLRDERLDITFNAVAGSTFKKDLKLLGSGGRMVIYGAAERTRYRGGIIGTLQLLAKMGLIIPILLMAKSRSLLGLNMLKIGDHKPAMLTRCMREVVDLCVRGEIAPKNGQVLPAEQLISLHQALEKGQTEGKIALRWE